MELKRILIAVDNSPISLSAAKVGIALAKQVSATVALVYVVDRNKEVFNFDIGLFPQHSEMLLLKQAQETLDGLLKMYKNDVAIHHFTPEGFPKEEIIAFSEKWNAHLIVMGTRGRTGLDHFLNGSVAEYVIKNA